MKTSNGAALITIIFWISLLGACAASLASETVAKSSANGVVNKDVHSLLGALSVGDSALVQTSDDTTYNLVISEISDTVLVESLSKVASSSSGGRLSEYGKQKTEKLRSQTSRGESVNLNIVDINDGSN